MSEPIWSWPLARVRDEIAARSISPVEAVTAVLERISARSRINAYITVTAEQALAQAREREQAVMRGDALGPLHGVPVALKDNIATRDVETTAGSPVRAGWIPQEDADVVTSLRAAGAIIIGKNNLFEAAFGAAHPRFGETLNPWDQTLSCGGSSSGSAAAVADGQAFASIGTDTGGSIRIPAAMCGVVGLKLTNGLVSNRGVVPVSPELDVVGPITRSVHDAELMLSGMGGRSSRKNHRAVTVGIPGDLREMPLAPMAEKAMAIAKERLKDGGLKLVTVDMPKSALSLDVMWTIASADIADYYRADLQFRAMDFCSQVRRNLIAGSMIPAIDYVRARQLLQRIRQHMAVVFAAVDVVLMPSLAIGPYTSGAQRVKLGAGESDVLPAIMQFTPLANVSGYPALVVPVAEPAGGPPPTVQIYGRPYEERTLLGVGAIVERPTVPAMAS